MTDTFQLNGLFDLDITIAINQYGKDEFYDIHKTLTKLIGDSSPKYGSALFFRTYQTNSFSLQTSDKKLAAKLYELAKYFEFNVIKRPGQKDCYALKVPLSYPNYEEFRIVLKNFNKRQNKLDQLNINRKRFFTDPIQDVIKYYGIAKFLNYMSDAKIILDNSSSKGDRSFAFARREKDDSMTFITKDRKFKGRIKSLGPVCKTWVNSVSSAHYVQMYTTLENFNKRVEEAEAYIEKMHAAKALF